MKRVRVKAISVFLMGWVLSAPLLISAHSTVYHSHLESPTMGLCRESCADNGHRTPGVKHDWCQVRVFNFLSRYALPGLITFSFSGLVAPLQTSPCDMFAALLPPSRASPLD